MVNRTLKLKDILADTHLLLLGPRQTGKSTLLKGEFKTDALTINLLESDTYLDLSKEPHLIRDIVNESEKSVVIIDEIQKVPELMDEVHLLIENNSEKRFILSGSSARKLRKKGVNLLGGRVFPLYLHPLTSKEICGADIQYDEIFLWGGIPSIILAKQKKIKMQAYIHLYLKEEILEEGLVRQIGPFSRFLDVAALMNTEQVEYSAVASDAQVSTKTIVNYFEILQDTLLGYLLPPFRESKTRKAVAAPKFYFFDIGIVNYLLGRESVIEKTPEFGKILEHFIFLELKAYIDYNNIDAELYYWRTQSQIEIDFIVKFRSKKIIAIEVKASENVSERHLKALSNFEEEFPGVQKIIVSNEKYTRNLGNNVKVYPYKIFCKKLWDKEIFY
jgi:predicted AAA+ superfamily ATPase